MKIILFDIDFTLLKTSDLGQQFLGLISDTLNISPQEAEHILKKYLKALPSIYYADLEDFIFRLDVTASKKDILNKQLTSNQDLFPKYDDVLPTLNELKKMNYRLGIYSEGVASFQKIKLHNLQLSEYLDPELIFIGQTKRSDEFLDRLPQDAYVVDDNSEVIQILQQKEFLNPIYLHRDSTKEAPQFETTVTCVTTLTDIPKLLD